ncbi:MAG TPA: hypothetical protein VFS67_07225 [Polyangiaceae bacterium]|nr:hypothetical protein [Polyangiaceae bacterium]
MNADPRLPRWTEEGSEVPAELRQWLRASREQLGSGEEIAELSRALARQLGPAAGLGSATTAAASKGWLAFGRWPAWLAAGTAGAALVWYGVSGERHAPEPAPAPMPVQQVEPAPAQPSSPEPSPPAPSVDRAPPPEPPPAPPRHTRASAPSTRESALLQRAQSALASDPARALALTEQHRRGFPRGALSEEREAIAIQALRRLGREPEARARAARFETKYPNSVHRSRVQATPAQQ